MYIYFTGVTNTLERVSLQVIVLNLPEKLVIETRASGGYQQYDWTRNGDPFGSMGFPVTPQEFPNFVEIFVREPTTTGDLGVYEANLVIAPGQIQIPDLQFCVTRYGKDHIIENSVIVLLNSNQYMTMQYMIRGAQ